MITCSDPVGKEIWEFLQSKLEIPENVSSLQLSMAVDELVTITCTYAPNAKKSSEDKP